MLPNPTTLIMKNHRYRRHGGIIVMEESGSRGSQSGGSSQEARSRGQAVTLKGGRALYTMSAYLATSCRGSTCSPTVPPALETSILATSL